MKEYEDITDCVMDDWRENDEEAEEADDLLKTTNKKNICKTCVRWVDCENKGYCVLEPLYTYTEKENCSDYVQGEPMKEDEN